MTNSITKEQIDNLMSQCEFSDAKLGTKTTAVTATLPNGFEVTETSACVDPANYDHDLGVSLCRKRIADRLWMLEGYALQQRLANRSTHGQGE